jgi:predicted permease
VGSWQRWIDSRRRTRAVHEDVERELREHLNLEIEEQIAAGKTPEQARTAALRTLGNLTLTKEDVRSVSTWTWWEQVRQDVRYSLRTFQRSPVFAATAVLTIALGVGANGAIFAVANALLLRPLPVSHPERLVVVEDLQNGNFSFPDYLRLRDGNVTLTGLLAASSLMRLPVAMGDDVETATGKIVSEDYFDTLGVSPAAGQLLLPGDEAAAAVISHSYWIRRFNQSTAIVGQAIRINGVSTTVVGVAPPDFFGEAAGEAPDFWCSMALQPRERLAERGFSWLYLMGRLKPGVSASAAQANLSTLFTAGGQPPTPGAELVVTSGASGLSRWRDRVESPLQVLGAIVGLVLLIACANLATLLLTRGAAREQEIRMRLAIGASRSRLVRQLMTETMLLAAGGGLLSLPFALWGGRFLVSMASMMGTGPDLALSLAVDAQLILFIAGVAIISGVLFGLVPAIREVRRASRRTLNASSRMVGTDGAWALRGALIAAQVALSLVLVIGSVMFIRTLQNLKSQPLGFHPDRLLRVEIERERGYRPPPGTIQRLLTRTAAIPGVERVTAVLGGTLANMGGVQGLQFDGFTPRNDQDRRARADWVGPHYFSTAGVRLIAGRDFSLADDERGARVAVVNQTTARHYFGADSAALGRRFIFNKNAYEIVGVAENAKYADLREQPARVVYFASLQTGSALSALEIRSSPTRPASLLPELRAAVREVDSRLRVAQTLTMTELVDRKLGREHLIAELSGFFGSLTVLLVSIGIYGTLAYTAGRRTKELGLRLALGARRGEVIALVLRDIAGVMLVGLAAGTLVALAGGRLIRSLLFGIEPTDAATFTVAAAVLVAAALTAGFLPAWRASRMDPAAVLRE